MSVSDEDEAHPLSLQSSLQKSIDKLIQHQILSEPLKASVYISPGFKAPQASAHLLSAILAAENVSKSRQENKNAFWSPSPSTVVNSNTNFGIDRVDITPSESKVLEEANTIPSKIDNTIISPLAFKQKYLYCNIPCIIKNISLPITEQWYSITNDGDGDQSAATINTEWFLQNIGESTTVPIRINQQGYRDGRAAECLTSQKSMKEWIQGRFNPQHYLKDWHMQSYFKQELYKIPIIFKDVLNPFLIENKGGDYRFVYWGCEGTSTPIHSDVLNSHSWSFNVVGKKRWTFYHPDDLNGSGVGALVVIQNKGEMMYVPSGWRHSVENMEETISVNHNWISVGALDCVFECLSGEIDAIEEEIDAWGIGMNETGEIHAINQSKMRENMLRGCCGMDISTFCVLIIGCFVECLVGILGQKESHNVGSDTNSSRQSTSFQTRNNAEDDEAWEQWFDFTCIVETLGIVLATTTDDEREPVKKIDENFETHIIVDLHGRLVSTFGHSQGCSVMDLMSILHSIGVDLIQKSKATYV